MDVVTNDRHHRAVEIAALYMIRWTIELLLRWLKQHLKLSRFLGRSGDDDRGYGVWRMVASFNAAESAPLEHHPI